MLVRYCETWGYGQGDGHRYGDDFGPTSAGAGDGVNAHGMGGGHGYGQGYGTSWTTGGGYGDGRYYGSRNVQMAEPLSDGVDLCF